MSTIGVTYKTAETAAPVLKVEDLQSFGIAYVRVQWVDLTNNIRYRVLPIGYFTKLLQSERPAVSLTKATLGLIFLSLADGFGPNGEYSYVFDLSSLKICPYAPGHASVMGWFQEKNALHGPVDICPRTLLARITADAKHESSVEFLVGFETEFILLKPEEGIEPRAVNGHGWSNSGALYTGLAETAALEEMADALTASGVEVQMYHSEGGPGQYEIVTGPLPPLQAADALVHTRETIYNIANKHGLRATLAPRVFQDSVGSGSHVHFSVHSTNPTQESTIPVDNFHLRSVEASFLAGLLDRLPSLILLTCPTYASYSRMQDGIWSGGTYVCWGVEHRETPIRVCNPTSPLTRNFELKMMDGTSNPYLALAGILGAGWSSGIALEKRLELAPITGPSTAAYLSPEDRAAIGIVKRLPLDLDQARENFSSDGVLRGVLGEGFVRSYLAVNKALDSGMTSSADSRTRQKLLIETY